MTLEFASETLIASSSENSFLADVVSGLETVGGVVDFQTGKQTAKNHALDLFQFRLGREDGAQMLPRSDAWNGGHFGEKVDVTVTAFFTLTAFTLTAFGPCEPQSLRQHHPQDIAALRAESQPNADLSRAPRHRIHHHAIQPHHRKEQGAAGEDSQ